MDHFHHGTTIVSITGGAVSATGGITAVAGMMLAPFTFGASLIATEVGLVITNVLEIIQLAHLRKAAGCLVRGIQIAGAVSVVLMGLFLTVDALYIGMDAKELRNGTKTKAAKKIREKASELDKGLQVLRELGKTFQRAQK
ncbi:hypothetical protein NDU88_000668 [Pleurodeles waltl]|uniref:Uncharacterized protein n=1 Tax=Pleurodeles waltl TaxID=8319 RepID=A0AAV7SX24_PLEWA|nr:hypothetical protein NDU88_000668 [Pleurodeles waltl]